MLPQQTFSLKTSRNILSTLILIFIGLVSLYLLADISLSSAKIVTFSPMVSLSPTPNEKKSVNFSASPDASKHGYPERIFESFYNSTKFLPITYSPFITNPSQEDATWIERNPSNKPAVRSYHTMAFDMARGETVLFGGYGLFQSVFGDTWVWDGQNWAQKSPVNSPSRRLDSAIVYDTARGQVVLFGGNDNSTTVFNDTWVWDGNNWTQKFPVHSPSGRAGHAMAYDVARQRVVLFGGFNFTTALGDTWLWDGSDWIQQSPAHNPPGRFRSNYLAYDSARGEVVLASGDSHNDTWTWNGSDWTQKTPITNHPVNLYSSLAYDAAHGKTLYFGGIGRNGTVNETWLWDGTNWQQANPIVTPPPRIGTAMAYDSVRAQVVLFGGTENGGPALNDTWVWTSPTTISTTCTLAPSNIVSWWPGDGDANDIAGDSHGTPQNGATFTTGLVGEAFSFDGINDSIFIPNSSSLGFPGPFTVVFWFNPAVTINPSTPMAPGFFSKGNLNTINLANDDGRLEVRGPSSRPNSTTNTWLAGTWYHIAVTFDTTSYKIYVNGELEDTEQSTYSILNNANDVMLGSTPGFSPASVAFNGLLDEVSLYKRALSTSEIQAIFQAGGAGNCKPSSEPSPITNVRARQLTDGSNQVEVLYDLGNVPQGGAISIAFSNNAGGNYDIRPEASSLSGDLGSGVSSGMSRRIIWRASQTLPAQTVASSFRAAVTYSASNFSTATSNLFNIDLRTQSRVPVPSFTFNPQAPAVGQQVNFTDTSVGTSLLWKWDFDGDGFTDATVQHPSYIFNTPGPHQVRLTVRNEYGEVSLSQTVNVSAPANVPSVTNVSRQYAGMFVQNNGLANRFDVAVNWQGTPGTLRFQINGGPPITEPGSAAGASHTFNMSNDFPIRLSASTLTITPVNGNGQVGIPWTERVYVIPVPSWLTAPTSEPDGGQVKVFASLQFPASPWNTKRELPEIIKPTLGDCFGVTDTFIRANAQFSSTGKSKFSLLGQTGFCALGQELEGRLGGSLDTIFVPNEGLVITGGSFNARIKGVLGRDFGLLDSIPVLRGFEATPVLGDTIRYVNDHAKLRVELAPFTEFQINLERSNHGFRYHDWEAGLGVSPKVTLKASITDNIGFRAWVSGNTSIKFGQPDPFFRQADVSLQFGAAFTIDVFWRLRFCAGATYTWGCNWRRDRGPDGGWVCSPGQQSTSSECTSSRPGQPGNFSATPTAWLEPLSADYARFGKQSLFKAESIQKKASAKVPLSVDETVLLSNVFPGASPHLLALGQNRLLLHVEQNASLPVLQSTNIAWSYNNGMSWSAPALLTNDTQAEIAPVAGVDAQQKVVGAWLRIKDPAFNTEITEVDNLPLFYNKLEVVSAVFDPATQTWSSVTQLTNNTAFETNLRLAHDNAGNLLLTWLSNDDGEFTSTGSSPSTLYYSRWDGTGWTSPAPVAVGLIGVNTFTVVINDDSAFIVLPRDPDSQTSGDGVLDLYTWNGSNWSAAQTFAAGGVENRLPSVVYDEQGEGHVVWLRGTDLVHATLSNRTPQLIRSGSASVAFYHAQLLINPQGNITLVWQEVVDNGPANIFAMIYDPSSQTWSADRRLNEDTADMRAMHGFYSSDGQLHLAYLATEILRTEQTVTLEDGSSVVVPEIPEEGRTDLRLLAHRLIVDLAVADDGLLLMPSTSVAGQAASATVDVHNAGDFSVGSFSINLYAGQPEMGGVLIGTAIVNGPFAAGDHREVTIPFTYPASGGEIVAAIDAGNQVAEFSETNNRTASHLSNTAPQARVVADITSGPPPLTVNFDASTSFDLEGDGITSSWSFSDGTPQAIGSQVTHTFNQVGLYPVTVVVTDTYGAVATATVIINVGCSPLLFTPAEISDGRAGAEYNQTITVSGGNPPYAFDVAAGELPNGLALSPSGQLSGTPTSPGQSIFTIAVTYANGCTESRDYRINIQPPCSYLLSQTFDSFRFNGGTGSVGIIAMNDCSWTAVSNSPWITVTTGNSGSGNGTITFNVAMNPSRSIRSGTLIIGGITYTVMQMGLHAQTADFDGDGMTDISVWQSDSGKWHIINSSDASVRLQYWGESGLGDISVPGDYDVDGKTDIAIYRPSEGNWYIIKSSDGTSTVQGWGQLGDRPIPADYDGDGKTDQAVYRPSEGNWYIRNSGGGSAVQGWGDPTDKLIPGDYDGDGRADIAVFRPTDGNWYILLSSGGLHQQQWGLSEDKPVPGDYDGDQTTDIAVFRPSEGNWYIIKSSGGGSIRNWGDAEDRPVPGDYDGDGKTDIAVWRPSQGTWYIIQSASNSGVKHYLGLSADTPIPTAYIP
jgi:PKD repeat protein